MDALVYMLYHNLHINPIHKRNKLKVKWLIAPSQCVVAIPFHCSFKQSDKRMKGKKSENQRGSMEKGHCSTIVVDDNHCSFFDSSALTIGLSEVGLIPSADKRSVRLG